MENLIDIFLTFTMGFLLFSIPIYWIYKLLQCFLKDKYKIFTNENFIFNEKSIEILYSFIIFSICFLMLEFLKHSVTCEIIFEKFEISDNYLNLYTPLSFKHIFTILILFFLGMISYLIIKKCTKTLLTSIYVICCSMLILNIIFSIAFLIQISNCTITNYLNIHLIFITSKCSFILLIIMYIIALKETLDILKKREKFLHKKLKNILANKVYLLFVKNNANPLFWIILSVPLLMTIQLILIPFGQQYDSFIKVFLDTNNYTFSKMSTLK